MERGFCNNCQKLVPYQRAIGFGTLFAILITWGVWLFAIPFYPKRCKWCGMQKGWFQQTGW